MWDSASRTRYLHSNARHEHATRRRIPSHTGFLCTEVLGISKLHSDAFYALVSVASAHPMSYQVSYFLAGDAANRNGVDIHAATGRTGQAWRTSAKLPVCFALRLEHTICCITASRHARRMRSKCRGTHHSQRHLHLRWEEEIALQ